MMDKVENVIKRICWKAYFFQKPMMHDNDNYTNYGLRSNISPLQNPVLTSFENDIYVMVRNIEFTKARNDFQGKLKEDTNERRSSKSLFDFAENSTNLYDMSDTDQNRLLGNNIISNYRNCENGVKHKIDKETKTIAELLDLSKMMECSASHPAFITIKDHKPNFRINTKCRLIYPAKMNQDLLAKNIWKHYGECCKHHQSPLMTKNYHCHRLV